MDITHFLQFSEFTFPGPYLEYLRDKMPDDIRAIGTLVRSQTVHKMILRNGNTGSNADLRYGDMTKMPWYRQNEDDNLPTAVAMISELFRRDNRGFTSERVEKDKIVITCRLVSILVASILKSKGIPTRVRSGFAPYFEVEGLPSGKSDDHWINQYWDNKQTRWITIDVDGSIEPYLKFDPYDIPDGTFDFSADAWLNVREGKIDADHFWNAGGKDGLQAIVWELFYDFHSLMNREVIYWHTPVLTHPANFSGLVEGQLKEIDSLARLMQQPDDNFEKLQDIWDTKKEFRMLGGGLL